MNAPYHIMLGALNSLSAALTLDARCSLPRRLVSHALPLTSHRLLMRLRMLAVPRRLVPRSRLIIKSGFL